MYREVPRRDAAPVPEGREGQRGVSAGTQHRRQRETKAFFSFQEKVCILGSLILIACKQ